MIPNSRGARDSKIGKKWPESSRILDYILSLYGVSEVWKQILHKFLVLQKMFIYGITIATLMQASCSKLFATLLKRKVI